MRKSRYLRFLGYIFTGWFLMSLIHHLQPSCTTRCIPTESKYSDYVTKLKDLGQANFIPASQVKSPTPTTINLVYIIVNTKNTSNFDAGFENKTRDSITGMLSKAGAHTPIHFIILSDEYSRGAVQKLLVSLVSRKLSMGVIKKLEYGEKKHIPPLHFSLVNYRDVASTSPEFLTVMRLFHVRNGSLDVSNRYYADFYNIAPLYHLAFTALDKIIVLDCADLEFKADIGLVNEEFKNLEESAAVIGIAVDSSPYYRDVLEIYNSVYESEFGMPGRFQGFNSGLVLYHLKRMRESEIYNRELGSKEVEAIFEGFAFWPSLAEQDWFTVLGFVYPQLFYVLPCQFNTQASIQMMKASMRHVFDEYHYCDVYENIKVVHRNGCGPTPFHCGNTGPMEDHVTQNYLDGFYTYQEARVDWVFIAGLKTKKRFRIERYMGMDVIVADDEKTEDEDKED